MTQSTHQVAAKGVDKTGAMFQSIGARAKATGAQIRSVMGGAIAAAGAYLSFRSIKSGIEELGRLDDIAAKTKTNVAELTQAVTGFQITGINTSVESFAKTLDYMRKNTGHEGLAGFYQTVEEIGKIPDAAERAKKAVEVFGRSGMELMPLIDNASKGAEAVKGVVAAMPSIPASAAAAGDKVKDAMDTVTTGIKSVWLQAIGAICNWFDGIFAGGIREAAAKASAYLEYYAKLSVISVQRAWKQITGTISKYGAFWGGAIGTWANGGGFMEGFDNGLKAFNESEKELADELKEIDRINNERAAGWAKKFSETMAAANNLQKNYNAATGGNNRGTSAAQTAGEEIGTAAAKAAHRVTNQLMLSGSSAANRLSVLGPEYQNETKKQTDLLKKIAQNTEKTAENTDEMGENYTPTDL